LRSWTIRLLTSAESAKIGDSRLEWISNSATLIETRANSTRKKSFLEEALTQECVTGFADYRLLKPAQLLGRIGLSASQADCG
jgi:hypothetical protein